MKRLLAFCFLLAWAFRCAAQAPTVYVDNLTGTNIIVTGTGCTNTILSCSIATSNGTLYSTWSPGMVFLFGDPQSINLDTTGLVLGPQAIFKTFLYQGTIRLSPADGAFHITPDVHFDNVVYGDGSGLTNLTSTNLVGIVNTTNLPSWVAYTPSNQTFTASNSFSSGFGVGTNVLVVPNSTTSNIRLQAGSANTLVVTNGVVGCSMANPNASYVLDANGTIHGTAITAGWAMRSPILYSPNAYAILSEGTASGQFQIGEFTLGAANPKINFATGKGINTAASTMGGTNIQLNANCTNANLSLVNGTNGPANFLVSGQVTSTNGLYYLATSNGVVSTNVIQPLHSFAALMGYVTNTINGGANTYAIVTNYSTARTNLMSCSLTAGTITNTIAGYYYCAIHMSMVALDAGALVEGDLLLNGVVRDEVSFQTQFDPGTPRYKGASAFGILYIPANSQITFQIKSSGASGIELRRQQLVVMPP